MLQLSFFLILGSIKSSYLWPVKRKEQKKKSKKLKEKKKKKKTSKKNSKKSFNVLRRKILNHGHQIQIWMRTKKMKEKMNTDRKKNHVKIWRIKYATFPNKKSWKTKKNFFFPFYFTYICIQVLWKYHFPLLFHYTFKLKHFWTWIMHALTLFYCQYRA